MISKTTDSYDWPLLFSYLLSDADQKKLAKIIPTVQKAQRLLWRALNIYDDLIDGEIKPEKKLIAANNYYRRFMAIHYQLNLPPDYYLLFNKLWVLWEQENKQEITRRNQPLQKQITNFKQKNLSTSYLANKSLILSSGSLALLFCLKNKLNSKVMLASLDFWRFFLRAKQLSDDSQDWQIDLKNNFLTFANINIALKINFNTHRWSLKNNDIYLNKLFIKHSAPIIIKELKKLTQQAKKSLKKINRHKSPLILTKLITPLEEAAGKSERFLKISGLTTGK